MRRGRCDLVPSPRPSPTGRGRKAGRRCGLMPSPRPSPMGREKYGAQVRSDALTPTLSHGEREKNGAQVRRDALTPTLSHREREKNGAQVRAGVLNPTLSHREREKNGAQVRRDALTPPLSHGEREKTGRRCGVMPSLRPSPTGRGREEGTTSPSPYSPPAAPLTALTCRKSPAVRSARYGPAQSRLPQRHRCSPAESPPPESTRLFRPDRQASG